MEAKTQIKSFNVQDIERFLNLKPDDIILYICAVNIKRCGNDFHKRMLENWLDFKETFPDIYYGKFNQTRENWPISKINDFKVDLIKGISDKKNGSLIELKILEEAVSLFMIKSSIT